MFNLTCLIYDFVEFDESWKSIMILTSVGDVGKMMEYNYFG